jgi:hypothetical protein
MDGRYNHSLMVAPRIGYFLPLLCGSVLACQSRMISSGDTGNTTSADTTSSGSSSESVAESESGVETETETSAETDTETGTDMDMDQSCVWEPAPPSECIPTDLPATPFDSTGYVLHDASAPALEIGPDGAVHVLAAQGGVDDGDSYAAFFTYQTNASGVWTVEQHQGGLAPAPELPSAISPSGVLHAARGGHVRSTNGVFLSSNPGDGSHTLQHIAWSRNGEYGYMYGNAGGGVYGDRAIWSSDGDCMTLEWILPYCGYHRSILAMGPDDRLHVLQVAFEEGFALLTLDGDALSTKWMSGLPADFADMELGDFLIDSNGTMHMCYGIEQNQTPASIRYVRFTEFGDWEELPLPELNPAASEYFGPPPCSLAVNDDGTVVWMTASTASDRVARIEDGVGDIIPTVVPFEGDIQLSDIELDDLEQPVLAGRCWADIDTYFVMRQVAGMWQLEHSFTI